ncbi:hypothetical protein TrST_g9799 [Triparma strigata]|uniref:Uncharacterized protein n=1 Tax=Triparma strigata TaxID=1606541 RepID=A0A9W7F0A0_9STRA|nr:hypothetical protein TrST_g9799 [Triparma strigata]
MKTNQIAPEEGIKTQSSISTTHSEASIFAQSSILKRTSTGLSNKFDALKASSSSVYLSIITLTVIQFFSFLLFLRTINSSHLSTFITVQTAPQYIASQFRNSNVDSSKVVILGKNRVLWRGVEEESIMNDLVEDERALKLLRGAGGDEEGV